MGQNLRLREIELLESYGKASMEELLQEKPNRFVNFTIKGSQTDVWCDTWADHVAEKVDSTHDMFFVYRLLLLDLVHYESFLNYHLERTFEGNLKEYLKYLTLTLRKWQDSLLDEKQSKTILEWIEESKKEETQKAARKGKIKRERDDNKIALTQEETAVLIYFLQKERVFLNDEYLNNTDAGEAFSILTGYSAETLRQKLGQFKSERLRNKKELTAVFNKLLLLQTA
ncbi:MAG TPA: hypothetical protein VD905_20785 [Flavobacteriales bacterium]|nr:hypothetical protein [Flavobacteriales bacterium]